MKGYMSKVLPVGSLYIAAVLLYGAMVSFVSASGLQVATTVTLQGVTEVVEGMVVVGDDQTQTYGLSQSAAQAQVFGVTAAKPSLVFVTDGNQVPVVTEGIALVRVSGGNGDIARGDVLITASSTGVAMRAGKDDQQVFAIALEPYAAGDAVGVIQAQISAEAARAVVALAQRAAELEAEQAEEEVVSFAPSIARAVIATVLAVGGLFFVLYSFRSAIVHGVVSIGRNPRARRSIMTLSLANIIFAIVLCAVVIFVAVAVLILPL
jgi:hypothetical protein